MIRYRLRTLLIAIALISVPLAWTGYSLRWINKRHEMIRQGRVVDATPNDIGLRAPWFLWVFGEVAHISVFCRPFDEKEVQRLFPEAFVHVI